MFNELTSYIEEGEAALCLRCVHKPYVCLLKKLEEKQEEIESRKEEGIKETSGRIGRKRQRSLNNKETKKCQEKDKEGREQENKEGKGSNQARQIIKRARLLQQPLAHQAVGGASNKPPQRQQVHDGGVFGTDQRIKPN